MSGSNPQQTKVRTQTMKILINFSLTVSATGRCRAKYIYFLFLCEYLKANLITPLGHESTHVEHKIHSE